MASAMKDDSLETAVDAPAEGTAHLRRFMTFGVGGLSFAVPLADVAEIIRRPALLRIPLGPPSLEGLARRLGEVLPVISLRRVLGLPESEDAAQGETARLLVVRHRGQPVGLAIDRVASILSVPEEWIGAAEADADAGDGLAEEGGVDRALLAGLIRADGGEGRGDPAAVMILDSALVIEREFGGLARSDALLPDVTDGGRAVPGTAARMSEELRIVGFDVDGQEFALPIEHVQEIVALPAGLTRVPRARPHLLGVVTLRDRLLPLIGLRELFGLTGTEPPAQRRVVVVQTGEEDGAGATGSGLVGVVVDGVREILRVEQDRVDPVPPLMAREAEFEDVAGIARLDGGRRLVSILSAERLFHRSTALRAALGSVDQGSAGQGREDEEGAMAGDGMGERTEQLVVFQLGGADYGLPVGAVQEVMRRPDALRPLPNAPGFVVGITTLRGAVLPVIDQRRLLRLPEAAGTEEVRRRVVVIGSGDRRAGLLVDGLSGIVRIPAGSITPAPAVSQAQHRLIRRVAHLEGGADEDRRMILLLDPDELLDMDQLAALLPSD